jgi:hypothetical protein
LLYLTITQPDITYDVILGQFLQSPSQAVYGVLRYLKWEPGKGLLHSCWKNLNIKIYTDVDWAEVLLIGDSPLVIVLLLKEI